MPSAPNANNPVDHYNSRGLSTIYPFMDVETFDILGFVYSPSSVLVAQSRRNSTVGRRPGWEVVR